MENKEVTAIKLGFESAEQMDAYYDVCIGEFKPGIVMTKELCDENIIDVDPEYKELLNLPREERLKRKILINMEILFDVMENKNYEGARNIRTILDFELSELGKCFEMKDQKTL